MTSRENLAVLVLGRRSYEEVWELQRTLQQSLIGGAETHTLILCEHEPVVTIGRSGNPENILKTDSEVPIVKTDRGGDVTYHGPGQLVGYPILDLKRFRTDVNWYLRQLEEVVIQALARFNIRGLRHPGRTGVWTFVDESDTLTPARKIASIGVRLSRWCTMHGFAVNVLPVHQQFERIVPCGLTNIAITSCAEEAPGGEVSLSDFSEEVVRCFGAIFELNPNRIEPQSCSREW